jgi:signal transduction histidine kinase
MSGLSQLKQPDGALVDSERKPQAPVKRPSRWALSNWSVRWKVFAIVLVPLILAGTFGGLRIYSSVSAESDARRAADRAEMVPAIESYMASLEGAMLASSTGGDAQTALTDFDTSRRELQRRLDDTDIAPDVRQGVTTMVNDGQALMDRVTSNSIGLRDAIAAYALLLLPAEEGVTGSVRVDDERVRVETLGLSRAVGVRGQMMMQKLAIVRGGELAEPELRTSMIALAGAEPFTLFGVSQVLGVGSPDAQKLQAEFVKRMALMTDPAVPLVNNPELSASIDATAQIARQIIDRTTSSVISAVDDRAAAARTELFRDSAIVGGAILLALIIVILVARSLVRPLRRLRDSALRVAHDDLTREIERMLAGGEAAPIEPIPVHTSEEVGQVAHAVDELHEQAVLLAGEQSRLQLQVGDMFETLSRRSRSLVDQQLSLIDRLERNEEDPERLESLFRLDHLAARMRRNGANLLVLAGAKVPREQAEPMPVSAAINAAASEVEDYTRVVTATVPDSEVSGAFAGDLVHLLAELLDNALRYSPPNSQVRVSAVRTGNGGVVIEVSDNGLGMTESDLRVANTRLQSGGEVNPYTARHMGLFVVGRLVAQHSLVVRLRSTVAGEPNSGTTAGVYVPNELLSGAGEAEPPSAPEYAAPAADKPEGDEQEPADSTPAQALDDLPPEPVREQSVTRPTDTSGFFAARAQAAGNGTRPTHVGAQKAHEAPEAPEADETPEARKASDTAGSDDAIYQKMLSEWLVDPTELANSEDLDWESVWDRGWSAAADAEEAPVTQHTEEGLPVRDPGARLVPGAAGALSGGEYRNGGESDEEVASPAEFDAGPEASVDAGSLPQRDPEAVRASVSSHFGGAHAGRSHAQETRGIDNE